MANNVAKKNKSQYNEMLEQFADNFYNLGYKDGYDDGVEDTQKDHDRAISEGTRMGSVECAKQLRKRKR